MNLTVAMQLLKSQKPLAPKALKMEKEELKMEQQQVEIEERIEELIENQEIVAVDKIDFYLSEPPPPPAPKSPLDYIIEMAKKGASFYFEDKEISSDKAIELLKNNTKMNIDSRGSTNKRPQVILSTKPIKIGSSFNIQNGGREKIDLQKVELVSIKSNVDLERDKIIKRLYDFNKYDACSQFYFNGMSIPKNKARSLYVNDLELKISKVNSLDTGLSTSCNLRS